MGKAAIPAKQFHGKSKGVEPGQPGVSRMELTKHPVIRKGKNKAVAEEEEEALPVAKKRRVRAARLYSTPSASGEPDAQEAGEEELQTVAGQESESEEVLALSQPPKQRDDQQKREKGAAQAGAHDRIV